MIAVAVVELVTMISVVYRVAPGQPPRPRNGRSWLAIAREAWGTDILKERSYVWLLASRFFYLMGGGILFNEIVTYLKQVHHLAQNEAAGVQFTMIVVVAHRDGPHDDPGLAAVGPARAQADHLRLVRHRRPRAS